jgi:hypothetical protein
MLEMLAIVVLGYTIIIVLLIARRKRRHFGLKHYESRPLPANALPTGSASPMGFSDGY